MRGHAQMGRAGALALETEAPAHLTQTTTPITGALTPGMGTMPPTKVAPHAHPERDPHQMVFLAALARIARRAVEQGITVTRDSAARGQQPQAGQQGGGGEYGASTLP